MLFSIPNLFQKTSVTESGWTPLQLAVRFNQLGKEKDRETELSGRRKKETNQRKRRRFNLLLSFHFLYLFHFLDSFFLHETRKIPFLFFFCLFLFFFCFSSHFLEILNQMISSGVGGVNDIMKDGWTALHVATQLNVPDQRRASIIQTLIDAGMKKNFFFLFSFFNVLYVSVVFFCGLVFLLFSSYFFLVFFSFFLSSLFSFFLLFSFSFFHFFSIFFCSFSFCFCFISFVLFFRVWSLLFFSFLFFSFLFSLSLFRELTFPQGALPNELTHGGWSPLMMLVKMVITRVLWSNVFLDRFSFFFPFSFSIWSLFLSTCSFSPRME